MATTFIIIVIITLCLGGLAYFMSSSLTITLSVVIVSLLYFLIYGLGRILKARLSLRKAHECYSFINQFIISLSVHKTISATYQQLKSQFSNDISNFIEHSGHLDAQENLIRLGEYFNSPLYRIFLDISKIYSNEGGNIIKMSEFLLSQIRMKEEELTNLKTEIYRVLKETIALWGLSFLILIMTKNAIGEIYGRMLASPIFIFFLLCYFLVFLFSAHLFISRFYQLSKDVHVHEI